MSIAFCQVLNDVATVAAFTILVMYEHPWMAILTLLNLSTGGGSKK